jgi:hypothetical protein
VKVQHIWCCYEENSIRTNTHTGTFLSYSWSSNCQVTVNSRWKRLPSPWKHQHHVTLQHYLYSKFASPEHHCRILIWSKRISFCNGLQHRRRRQRHNTRNNNIHAHKCNSYLCKWHNLYSYLDILSIRNCWIGGFARTA